MKTFGWPSRKKFKNKKGAAEDFQKENSAKFMPNIILNTNYNASYKSAYIDKLKNFSAENDMTFSSFTEAVNWINSDQLTEEIGISGAEPLVHPMFDDFMELLKIKREPEQSVTIYTDGIHVTEHIDTISSLNPLVRVRVAGSREMPHDISEKIRDGIRLLRIKGINICLDIEFTEKNIDTQFPLDLIKEFSIREVKISLPPPESEDISGEFFDNIEEPMLNFVEQVAKCGSSVGMGCQYMPICHTVKCLRKIQGLQDNNKVNVDLFGTCNCTPVLDILPSLHIARCYGMMEEGLLMPIKAFNNAFDARNFFSANVDYIAQIIPVEKKCISCYDKVVGNCQGGCIAFKLDRFLDMQKELKKMATPPTKDIEIIM